MQPTTTNLTAIDNILTRVGADPAHDPFMLSAVYADAAARATVKAAAATEGSPYFARWSGVMGELGWHLTATSAAHVSLSARGAHPALIDLLAAADPTAAAALALVKRRAGQASEGLDFWWSWVGVQEGELTLGFAAADGPRFTASFFSVPAAQLLHPRTRILRRATPVDTSTWAALLAPLDAAPVDIGLRQFTASLDVDHFAASEAQVRAALGDKFTAHYQTVA